MRSRCRRRDDAASPVPSAHDALLICACEESPRLFGFSWRVRSDGVSSSSSIIIIIIIIMIIIITIIVIIIIVVI